MGLERETRNRPRTNYSAAFITRKAPIAKSVAKLVEQKTKEIQAKEEVLCDRMKITWKQWISFIGYIQGMFVMDKSDHVIFFEQFTMVLDDLGMKFNPVSAKSNVVCTSRPSEKMAEEQVDLYCFDSHGNHGYVVYRMFKHEFRAVMYAMFSEKTDWAMMGCALSNVPSIILRGVAIYFGERAKYIVHGIPEEMLKINPVTHTIIDTFAMRVKYNSDHTKRGTLATERYEEPNRLPRSITKWRENEDRMNAIVAKRMEACRDIESLLKVSFGTDASDIFPLASDNEDEEIRPTDIPINLHDPETVLASPEVKTRSRNPNKKRKNHVSEKNDSTSGESETEEEDINPECDSPSAGVLDGDIKRVKPRPKLSRIAPPEPSIILDYARVIKPPARIRYETQEDEESEQSVRKWEADEEERRNIEREKEYTAKQYSKTTADLERYMNEFESKYEIIDDYGEILGMDSEIKQDILIHGPGDACKAFPIQGTKSTLEFDSLEPVEGAKSTDRNKIERRERRAAAGYRVRFNLSDNIAIESNRIGVSLNTGKVINETLQHVNFGKLITMHEFDLGLHLFEKAIEFKNVNGGFIGECYVAVKNEFNKLTDAEKRKDTFRTRMSLEAIFGPTVCIADVIKMENVTKTKKGNRRRFVSFEKMISDDREIVSMIFDRKENTPIDVAKTLNQFAKKYNHIFRFSAPDSIKWDESVITVKLDSENYENLIRCVNVFELSHNRTQQVVLLHPLIVECVFDYAEEVSIEAFKAILNLVNQSIDTMHFSSRWINQGWRDCHEYCMLLPRIIDSYETENGLWYAMTEPYLNEVNMYFGTDTSSERPDSYPKAKRIKRKDVTGFVYGSMNIYVGLEAFFAVNAHHSVNKLVLWKILEFLGTSDTLKMKYENFYRSLLDVSNGKYQPRRTDDSELLCKHYEVPFYADETCKVSNNDLHKKKSIKTTFMWNYYSLLCEPEVPCELVRAAFEGVIMREEFTRPERHHFSVRLKDANLDNVANIKRDLDKILEDELCRIHKSDNRRVNTELYKHVLFSKLVEWLERLSYYNTKYKSGHDEKTNPEYRGSQKMPTNESTWLNFNYTTERDPIDVERFPVYCESDIKRLGEFILMRNGVVRKFTGRKYDLNNSLSKSQVWDTMMGTMPEFLNCLFVHSKEVQEHERVRPDPFKSRINFIRDRMVSADAFDTIEETTEVPLDFSLED